MAATINLGNVLPPQINNSIWQISPEAIKNTMTYIFDVLRHPCYLVGIRAHKVFFYKIVPGGGTAPTIIPALKTSLATLHKNRHLMPQQIADIKRGVDIHDTRIMQCILKTFAEKPEKLNEYYQFLLQCEHRADAPPPNGLFLLNLTDATILREDGNMPFPYVYGNIPIPNNIGRGPFLPIMGAGQKGYCDIPIPNYDEINRIVDNSFVDYLAVYEMDWAKKQGRAIFRGGPSGCGATATTNMRIALAIKKHPLVDACIVGRGDRVIKYDPKFGLMKINQHDISRALCSNQKGTPMTTQSTYKYIIHIDGNVNAYRLLGTMLTGSLILRVRSNYIHWADHLIRAGVHYIEIAADLSNLDAVLEWCQKHDNKCREIAAAGLQAAAMLIERPFIESLFIKYMQEFTPSHLKYTPHTPSFSPPPLSTSHHSNSTQWPNSPDYPPPLSNSHHSISTQWPNSPDYPPPPLSNSHHNSSRSVSIPTPTPTPTPTPQLPKRKPKRILIEDAEPTTIDMPKSGRCPRGYNRAIINGTTLCKSKEAVPIPEVLAPALLAPALFAAPPPQFAPVIKKVVAEVLDENNKILDDPDIIPLSGKRCPAGYGAVIIQTRKYCRRKRPAGGTKTLKYRGGNTPLYEKDNLKTIRDKTSAIEIAMAFV